MRVTFRQAVWLAAVLVAAALAPTARAQGSGSSNSERFSLYYSRQAAVQAATALRISAQTTVMAPDGGEALVGGYSRLGDGRNTFGAPGLGRGGRNVGYGRSAARGTVSIRVRIIDLREEEYRQTGVRSR